MVSEPNGNIWANLDLKRLKFPQVQKFHMESVRCHPPAGDFSGIAGHQECVFAYPNVCGRRLTFIVYRAAIWSVDTLYDVLTGGHLGHSSCELWSAGLAGSSVRL